MSKLILGLLCFGDIYLFVVFVLQTIMTILTIVQGTKAELSFVWFDRCFRLAGNILTAFVFDSVYMLYKDNGVALDRDVEAFLAIIAVFFGIIASVAYWKHLRLEEDN